MTAAEIIEQLRKAWLILRHPEVIERFCFLDETHVSATLGAKGGYVSGPILDYRIEGDVVVLSSYEGKERFRWSQLQLEADVLRLQCAGVQQEFDVTREPSDLQR